MTYDELVGGIGKDLERTECCGCKGFFAEEVGKK